MVAQGCAVRVVCGSGPCPNDCLIPTVVIYTFYWVIFHEKDYRKIQFTEGYTYTKIKGRVRSDLGFFDEADIAVQDPLFVTTRLRITESQTQGYCAPVFPNQTILCDDAANCTGISYPRCLNRVCMTTVPCATDTDCQVLWNARCNGTACVSWQWCPPEGAQGFYSDNQTVAATLEGVGDMTIWFRSVMQFPELGRSVPLFTRAFLGVRVCVSVCSCLSPPPPPPSQPVAPPSICVFHPLTCVLQPPPRSCFLPSPSFVCDETHNKYVTKYRTNRAAKCDTDHRTVRCKMCGTE